MLYKKTIAQLHDGLTKKKFSSREIVESTFKRIDEVEPCLGAYLHLDREAALKTSDIVDAKIKKNEPISMLAGIPIAVKDNICHEGVPTTCASRMLEKFIPPYDATVITKLKAADAVLLGKTNMDEFAMGSSTENSAYKPAKNPWDITTVPGGSSGGSAVAVSASIAAAALGSDTGGSIRQPASFCGIVGYKPTYGMVSRYGLVAFASSLDQIGPLAKTVQDAAILSSVICGFDEKDSTSAKRNIPDYLCAIEQFDVRGLKIGVPAEHFKGLDSEIAIPIKNTIRKLESLGADIVDLSLPHGTEYAVSSYYILATAEASSNLSRYDGVKYGLRYQDSNTDDLMESYMNTRSKGFGREVKRRIMLGTYVLSSGYYDAYYIKAQKVRRLIKEELDTAFKSVDVLLTPTTPSTAFRFGEKIQDPLKMYLSDIFTISVNLAGNPAISVPCGLSTQGMPIGLQLIGKSFDEETIFKVAKSVEENVFQPTQPEINLT